VEKLGKVAYRLALPPGARIHLVLYILALKKKIRDSECPQLELPPITDDGDMRIEPQAILDYCWVRRGSMFVEEGLVQKKQLPADNATWEDLADLK
jgi:hypothetical protein